MRSRVKRIWRTLAPDWIRETRLFHFRCRSLIPSRITCASIVVQALICRLLRRKRPIRLTLPSHDTPIHVRPFTSDTAVAIELFVDKDYESARQIFRTPKTVIDLGANIGLSIRLWNEWYTEAKILAVEPNPYSLAIAKENVSLMHNSEQVELLECAIAPAEGTARLLTKDQPWSHRVVDDSDEDSIGVATTTMLNCLDRMPNGRADLCKCDIEGGEASLFRNCGEWINRIQSLIVETHMPYTVEDLMADLARNRSQMRLRRTTNRGQTSIAFLCADEWMASES